MSKVIETKSGYSTAEIVASNIRAEAARLGFSQSAFGRALGMSQTTINARWLGLRPWQLEELDTVASLLGVSVVDLITEPRSFRVQRSEKTPAFAGVKRWAHRESNPEPTD